MKKKQKPFKPSAFTTIIGKGTLVKGDVIFVDGLHLDGEVQGNIIGQGKNSTLTISDQSRVTGDIQVDNIIVNGHVEGNVHAIVRVELAESAVVIGKIQYSMLEMAMGARVEGEMIRLSESQEEEEGNS